MKRKAKITAIFCLIAMCVAVVGGYIASGTAGTDEDPLISLSYLNDVVIPNITSTVQNSVQSYISDEVAKNVAQSTGTYFVAIQGLSGQTITCHEGTELILRSGSALSVCPGSNGLVDSTAGFDLTGGNEISLNHVYIIPRQDGRGIYMTTDGYVMIKGGYDIE